MMWLCGSVASLCSEDLLVLYVDTGWTVVTVFFAMRATRLPEQHDQSGMHLYLYQMVDTSASGLPV